MNTLFSKIHKRITAITLVALILVILSGCASHDGKVAKSVAEELMESGHYEDAEKQCAIAVGNGVTDKDFVHMYDILKAYNSALDLYNSGDTEKAQSKLAEISDYSDYKIASDIDKLKDSINDALENSEKIDNSLDEIEDLYNNEKYDIAHEKMLELDEYNMSDDQKSRYDTLQEKINNKSTQHVNSVPSPAHSQPNINYSQYDSSLSKAYIMGAESGYVYFWDGPTGNAQSTAIPNGTTIYTTSQRSNGRTLVKWNGRYGWVTSKYVNIGDASTYTSQYHIQGASSGSVYVWKYSYGDEHYTTISNGTAVSPTGKIDNGRVQIHWGNGYAWITAEYVG
ncbi:MAG: hypothetical protein IJH37_11535 [Clostridia bacterium]|nr:hypothetical protein [Clostridia bacterium]